MDVGRHSRTSYEHSREISEIREPLLNHGSTSETLTRTINRSSDSGLARYFLKNGTEIKTSTVFWLQYVGAIKLFHTVICPNWLAACDFLKLKNLYSGALWVMALTYNLKTNPWCRTLGYNSHISTLKTLSLCCSIKMDQSASPRTDWLQSLEVCETLGCAIPGWIFRTEETLFESRVNFGF